MKAGHEAGGERREGEETPARWRCPWWGWVLIALHVPPAIAMVWRVIAAIFSDMTGGGK